MAMRLSFKVSARTARLIGRENVATSKGAIIELVKNAYDADSPFCIVLFEQSHDTLYIVDGGEGMTQRVISNNWMTIGTDNKATNGVSRNGRFKTGAKGIGRFALDRLGEKCEMITFFNKAVSRDYDVDGLETGNDGYRWTVNWNLFEDDAESLENIDAELDGLKGVTFQQCLSDIALLQERSKLSWLSSCSHGTILKISGLRDSWNSSVVKDLYEDLGTLVPATESSDFNLYLFSEEEQDDYGQIESTFCQDYDYKIVAQADRERRVKIRIYRKEYDIDSIPNEFFAREQQQKYPYTIDDFKRGYWDVERTFEQLLPGFKAIDQNDTLGKIGPFSFTMYYLKKSASKKDIERFHYRICAYKQREDWLAQFGGIKLFRDGFRVRPYGERNNSSYDWLGLGMRKSKNPVGIAKKSGGYRVEVDNTAGSISISRSENIYFEDKSSREGVQENAVFQVFKQLIVSIISIFEADRAFIAREMALFEEDRSKKDLEAKVKKFLRSTGKTAVPTKTEPGDFNNTFESLLDNIYYELLKSKDIEEDLLKKGSSTAKFITKYFALNQQKEEIRQLREEQKVLQAMASSGIVVASFGHDLSKMEEAMGNRYDTIEELFSDRMPREDFDDVDDFDNPYIELDEARKQDEKLKNWLSFSIGSIRKDKRKRKSINLPLYFENLSKMWNQIFSTRAIEFDYTQVEDVDISAFEIDLDSIFYNFFSNSIEAFNIQTTDRPRKISIKVSQTGGGILCEYRDSGDGLSADIANPEDIFKPLFTTKRDLNSGEEIGTGLGLWIVKSVAEQNDASLKLLDLGSQGFGIQIVFPITIKEE